MANYTFTFKKDDIFVEFTTTDKDMMNEQFGLWVTDATEYAKSHPSVEKKNLEAVDRQKRYEARRQERLEKEAKRKAELEQKQREADKKAALLQEKERALQEQSEQAEKAQQEKAQQENLQQENNNANEVGVAPAEPVTINSLQAKVETPAPQAQVQPQAQAAPDFDKLLEQKLANPTFAPNELKDERFVEFFNSKNHETKLQHLVIAAFYLLQFEKIERFTLKQINSKLMHNISEVIDHAVLQDAMNSGIIEVYPDLTGTSEIREYRLTEKGEDFFINGLQ